VCPVCVKSKTYPVRNETCSRECADESQRRIAEGKAEALKPIETVTLSDDSWRFDLKKTRIASLEELVAAFKVDLTEWKVKEFKCNKWEGWGFKKSVKKDGGAWIRESSEVHVQPLFQINATFLPKREIQNARAELLSLKEYAKKNAPRAPRAVPVLPTGNMLEINIPDLHVGKLARGKETGYKNYDVHLAVECHDEALEGLIARSAAIKYEEILYVVGNDLLNSDDVEGCTTAGTSVSNDGRYKKTFKVVRHMVTRAIERLRAIAPVRVVMVEGNHDRLSVWHLGDSLECHFANYTDVKIDNSETTRKYHKFGKVMLMLTHGDKGKKLDKPLLMATEQRKMWGGSKFCEVHTGHLHSEQVWEKHGVKVRVLPSLCSEDDWHSQNEFTGNIRSAIAYQWNKNAGLIGTTVYNLTDDEEE
jgi:5S rRNA maturation endonuclease (ribonuclease M5)